MKRPMEGVRIVEVAQYTFVPASGGVLAEWGAEVIKVEHAVRGDAQRGLVKVLGLDVVPTTSFFPIMEGPNRGKRSVGIALEVPEGRALLDELIRSADVFVTNFLPNAREKLRINLDDVRAVNPDIIYVRGTGFGARGEDAGTGGYDSTAFWSRGGSADGVTPDDADRLASMPSGAYGDSIGGMTIAGGIAAALYARKATGEPTVVDVSLLGVGAWATQFSVNQALLVGGPLPKAKPPRHGSASNPLHGSFRTADGRWLTLAMLQPTKYWPEFCERMGRPDLMTDPRFAGDAILANGPEGGAVVAEIIGGITLAEWRERMRGAQGQWAAVQNAYEVGMDPALRENGLIAKVVDADGVERELVANPVQFDETPVESRRAPQFAEHTDDVLRELGKSEEEIIDLKIAGAVT
ncbi:CaiB/BaiF CoA transferase family protein [Streptomyces sp. NPDC090499]|uniref:CaiB/BaiF CoA transferase family protein n=1 Tax=Streptomyces sp. NPDC090499 TaxID=3365965 RepID=UPI0038191578